jgi:hypothetical protein
MELFILQMVQGPCKQAGTETCKQAGTRTLHASGGGDPACKQVWGGHRDLVGMDMGVCQENDYRKILKPYQKAGCGN